MLAASKRKDTAPCREPSVVELLHQAALACFAQRENVKSHATYIRLTVIAKSLLELEKDALLSV